eukprot:NODE_2168_length_502_cov_475.456954_g1771_i0.p4 GENE.NODE_2168_length_502_cov_475.456954_g1771_i0~~NODE_2168_length_502_cov_475.456954_g1771_i0.p4  ORF type:complete len:51 (-),score=10.87 NODE_2168_length_502_cov_475.456954_g1771_i0:20-172(-)
MSLARRGVPEDALPGTGVGAAGGERMIVSKSGLLRAASDFAFSFSPCTLR